MHYDIVFHVDNEASSLKIALANVANVFKGLTAEEFSLALVVNGPAVQHLTCDGEFAQGLSEAMGLGLSVRACNNALTKFEILPKDLCPGIQIVPAGILEVVDLQRAGYAYIKP